MLSNFLIPWEEKMKNLMKLFICLTVVLSFNTQASDAEREYREKGSGWIFTVKGEKAALTHCLYDVEYALTCEPMDCGEFSASCSGIDGVNVDITCNGIDAFIYGDSFPENGIALFYMEDFDPAITVHDGE